VHQMQWTTDATRSRRRLSRRLELRRETIARHWNRYVARCTAS
jgi:hypothetical protein